MGHPHSIELFMTENKTTSTEALQNEQAPSTEAPKRTRKTATRKSKASEKQEETLSSARKSRTTRKSKSITETPAPVASEEVSITEVKQPEVSVTESQVSTDIPQPKEIKVQPLPTTRINNIIELSQAPQRAIILTDQQIQTLTLEEIESRHIFLENTLANVLDYDIVISDTNIWLELLIGHTSSHSDPRYNARLQFERQLEFISRLTHYRGGRFMMMGETYEEIDRFASMSDPTNHREADWTDNVVCLNAAARLAKRLILAQQRENRLRIVGIGAESHHAAFADPAIVRKVAELFAEGKKVLLLTNDTSVAIRSLGICDDLQQHNNISDKDWDELYAPIRPMVFTFDDLKLLDYYTRQYHYIQMAAGKPWMSDIPQSYERIAVPHLALCLDAFKPGDKHRGDNLFTDQEKQQVLQNQQKQKQQANTNQQKQQPNANQQKQQANANQQKQQANVKQKKQQTNNNQQKQQEKQARTPLQSPDSSDIQQSQPLIHKDLAKEDEKNIPDTVTPNTKKVEVVKTDIIVTSENTETSSSKGKTKLPEYTVSDGTEQKEQSLLVDADIKSQTAPEISESTNEDEDGQSIESNSSKKRTGRPSKNHTKPRRRPQKPKSLSANNNASNAE